MADLLTLRRQLGQLVLSKRRIYLDTKFWNTFCDVEFEGTTGGEAFEALTLLRKSVLSGDCVCPAEYSVLNEVLRQRLPDKRTTTALLVDELSDGVLVTSAEDRVTIEVSRFVQNAVARRPTALAPTDEVWTRPAFAFGHLSPDNPGLPEHLHAWAVERTQETLWSLRFSDVMDGLSDVNFPLAPRQETINRMNAEKLRSRPTFQCYEELYAAEIRGALDVFSPSLEQVILYLWTTAGGAPGAVSASELQSSTDSWKRLIAATFFEQSTLAARSLPTLHIYATAYARAGWDARRAFKANDLADFSHAAAALPYCNVFATERSLAELIRQSGLAELYGTLVVTDCAQLSSFLSS